MKTRTWWYFVALLSISAAIGTIARNAQSKGSPDPGPACSLTHEDGFIKSWSGQPGVGDHAESLPIKKGDYLACEAFAAFHSPIPPACFLQYENGDHYTLPHKRSLNAPTTGVVTLSCNGKSPTCCKVQVGPQQGATTKEKGQFKEISSEEAAKPNKP
jgi:hypothetical protein